MKQHVIKTDELEWVENNVPRISPDRRGFYKVLSSVHGIGQFEARLTRIPPTESNTWYHTHSICEEWFYVLEGQCHLNLNGDWRIIEKGDSVATEPGDWHIFRNFGNEDCNLIIVGINDSEDQATRQEEPLPPADSL